MWSAPVTIHILVGAGVGAPRYDAPRDARRKPNRSTDRFLEHKHPFMFNDHLAVRWNMRDWKDAHAVFPYDQEMTSKHHKIEKAAKLERKG